MYNETRGFVNSTVRGQEIMKRILVAFTVTFSLLCLSVPCNADSNAALQLYQQVISGQKKLDSLSPEQQQQVMMVHGIVSRSSCDGCSDECRDAKEQAESYRDDLESYTKRLYRCVDGNDLTDDCYSEFRRVKSAHSDFESAVSDVGSYCD